MVKRTVTLLFFARIVDVLGVPLTALAGLWLRAMRQLGFQYMPVSKRLLLGIGVLPVRDHYYEPMVNPRHLRRALSVVRNLPAVEMNDAEQLGLLARFDSRRELAEFPLEHVDDLTYHYHNPNFGSGDAEYLYSLIRLIKPRKLIEIGSGFSTLMARSAICRNEAQHPGHRCEHICIEPYEQPWLEKLGIDIRRQRVEDCDAALFASLQSDDILFIDSSHVVRPQGDVLFECLEVLPGLQAGVYVHIHDIFTPRDYPPEWVVDEIRLWNEQYLVEAFLSFNREFRIVGALNHLKHDYPAQVCEKFPVLEAEMETNEPASLWLRRVSARTLAAGPIPHA